MKAKVERHGTFDYRADIDNCRVYAKTKWGIMREIKKVVKSTRNYQRAKAEAIEIEV